MLLHGASYWQIDAKIVRGNNNVLKGDMHVEWSRRLFCMVFLYSVASQDKYSFTIEKFSPVELPQDVVSRDSI